jgi:hypothetical protein
VHIPRIQDAPQFFKGKKCLKCVSYIRSNTIYIVTCRSVCLWARFWLVNGFTDHLYTRLGITSNYSATANLQNSQTTTAPGKAFSSLLSSPAVPWQRLLTVEILQLHALRSSLHSLPYRTQLSKSKSRCDWRSVSKSWCRAPDIYYSLTVTVALSDESTDLTFVPCL